MPNLVIRANSATGIFDSGGGGEPSDYLYDTTFASASLADYSADQVVDFDGIDWFIIGDTPALVSDATAPSGKALRFNFNVSNSDGNEGAVINEPLPGAGKKLHAAILLRYDGYSDLDGLTTKKQIRMLANGAASGTIVATLDAQFGTWRLSFEDSGGGVVEQETGLGPTDLIGTGYFWLELMVDFTAVTSAEYAVYVNGSAVSSGTMTGISGFGSGWSVDGFMVSTIFNGYPSGGRTGTDHIGRIIASTSFIGVPT